MFEEMLFEGLTGIVGSESQNGDMTPSFQIRYSTSFRLIAFNTLIVPCITLT